MGRRSSHSMLCASLLSGALGLAGRAHAAVLLQDGFGIRPLTTAGGTRFDAAGNVVAANVGSAIDGLRAEDPFTSTEVWTTGNIRHTPTWSFDGSPPDPFEQYGSVSQPTPEENGGLALVVAGNDTPPPGLTDALLPFIAPVGGFQESLDFLSGSGGSTLDIGFTSDNTVLFDNFKQAGQLWLQLTTGVNPGVVTPWTLHTNGLTGPSLSGVMTMQTWNQIILSYDPGTHTVQASINGVLTGPLDYTASGITGVGLEGTGAVDNFIVRTGALANAAPSAVPEPTAWALMIVGFGGLGLLARRRNRLASLA
jgi:PEP-CTERM motif-containing protein